MENCVGVLIVAGIALLLLGVRCWSGSLWLGMWLYNLLVTLFLLCLATATQWHGWAKWPVIAIHAVMTVLLTRQRLVRSTA